MVAERSQTRGTFTSLTLPALAYHATHRSKLRRARPLLSALGINLAGLFGIAHSAQAEVELSFAAGCGSQTAFLGQLREQHGLEADDVTLQSLTITAREPTLYVLTVEGSEGVRELTDADCVTLVRTALVIAAASARAQSSASPEPPAPSEARPSDDEPAPTDRISSPLHYWMGAAGGVEFNLAPDPAWLLEAHAALASGSLGVSLTARYLLPSAAEGLTDRQHGLQFQALGARLGLLHRPAEWARIELGLGVDRLGAEARGVRRPSFDSVWLAAPDLELALIPLVLGDVAFELAIRGRVALNRPRFVLEPDAVELYRLPRLGATGLFRINWGSR